jgi:hypothetical protein
MVMNIPIPGGREWVKKENVWIQAGTDAEEY